MRLLVKCESGSACDGCRRSTDGRLGFRYFVAANPSIDRHVYSAPLPSSDNLNDYQLEITPLTDDTLPGYYDVSFSPGAGYHLLSYQGPEVPYQRLIETAHGGLDGGVWRTIMR